VDNENHDQNQNHEEEGEGGKLAEYETVDLLEKKERLAAFELQEILEDDHSSDPDYQQQARTEDLLESDDDMTNRAASSRDGKGSPLATDQFNKEGHLESEALKSLMHHIVDTCWVQGKRNIHFDVPKELLFNTEGRPSTGEREFHQRGGETCLAILSVLMQMFGRDLDYVSEKGGLTEKWNRALRSWNLFGRYRAYAMEEEKQKGMSSA